MKKILDLFKKNLFLASKLIKNFIKIDYLYYFIVVLFFYILLYKFTIYITTVKNYSLSQISIFFLISTFIYSFIKFVQDKPLKKIVSNFSLLYGKIAIIIYFLFYVVLNILFFKGTLSFFFLYSTIFLFIIYFFLRFIGVKFEYNIFQNNIEKEDIFSFYTIFIVVFLFFFSFLFSTDLIPLNLRSIIVIFGFLISSFCFIFVFNNELFISQKNYLYSRKNRYLLRRIKLFGSLFILIVLISSGYFFSGDIKKLILNPDNSNNTVPELIGDKEIEHIINDVFETSTGNTLYNTNNINSSTGNIIFNTGTAISNTGSNIFNTGTLNNEKSFISIGKYFNFNRYIGLGNYGEDVKVIQEILSKEGFYNGNINGVFNELTSNSLDSFIESKTGMVGKYNQLGPKTMQIFKNIEIER